MCGVWCDARAAQRGGIVVIMGAGDISIRSSFPLLKTVNIYLSLNSHFSIITFPKSSSLIFRIKLCSSLYCSDQDHLYDDWMNFQKDALLSLYMI